MKRYSLLVVLPSVFFVLLGCADDVRKGEAFYVQEVEGLPGYTVYIRDAETPKVTRTFEARSPRAEKTMQVQEPDNMDKTTNPLSSLYYYRSTNPNRLTRVRLRRF